MRYESGAKVQDLRIKIREERFEVVEGVKIRKPGLIIEFENGEFDSEEWQADDPENRTDALRQLVERMIEKDPHFGQIGNPRGLWHMTAIGKRLEPSVASAEELPPAQKCEHVDIVDGQGRACPNDAVPGARYCDDHILVGQT